MLSACFANTGCFILFKSEKFGLLYSFKSTYRTISPCENLIIKYGVRERERKTHISLAEKKQIQKEINIFTTLTDTYSTQNGSYHQDSRDRAPVVCIQYKFNQGVQCQCHEILIPYFDELDS